MSQCSSLWSHTLDDTNMQVVTLSNGKLIQKCKKCTFQEELPYSGKKIGYLNNLVMQQKKYAADESRKEMLQPVLANGQVSDEFTEAYGYNPFDKTIPNKGPHKSAI